MKIETKILSLLVVCTTFVLNCSKSSESSDSTATTATLQCTSTRNLTTDDAGSNTTVVEGTNVPTLTANVTIPADSCISFKGKLHVPNGVTLTINPGTTILADTSIETALIIDQGGKIDAQGTVNKPIVFTPGVPAASKSPGAWGGIVIHGNAPVSTNNSSTSGTTTELKSGPYGGNTANDNSGTLKYVRIEYAGYLISANSKEYNGLTLYGVGSGTTIDYVQALNGSDDGFEMFGGTVNLKHVLATGNEDDGLDWTEGWQGTIQFAVVTLDKSSNNAIEGDGGVADTDGTVSNAGMSVPVLSNITILGSSQDYSAGTYEGSLINIRKSGGVKLYNTYIGNVNEKLITVNKTSLDYRTGVAPANGTNQTSLIFQSIVMEKLTHPLNPGGASTAITAIDSLICGMSGTALNEVGTVSASGCTIAAGSEGGNAFGTDAMTLANAFPDGSTNVTVGATLSYNTAPSGTTRWGVSGGIGAIKPSTVGAITGTPTAPTGLTGRNGTTLSAGSYIGAFSGSGDTWADTWTVFNN